MRLLLLMLGISVSVVGIGTRAEAQNYPWCAIYSGFDDGGTNCGFTTFQQCMDTARGMGNYTKLKTPSVLAPARAGAFCFTCRAAHIWGASFPKVQSRHGRVKSSLPHSPSEPLRFPQAKAR